MPYDFLARALAFMPARSFYMASWTRTE